MVKLKQILTWLSPRRLALLERSVSQCRPAQPISGDVLQKDQIQGDLYVGLLSKSNRKRDVDVSLMWIYPNK